jgi:hypothetical protein
MFASLVLAATLSAVPALEGRTQLTYAGKLSPVKDDGNPVVKEFELLYLVPGEQPVTELTWVLSESGRGGWTWLDHFGRWTPPIGETADADRGPALLYFRDEGRSIVPLISPLYVAPRELSHGATWEVDRFEYRVTGEAAKTQRDCWEIEVRTAYGHKRTLWVAKDQPLVLAVRETVFMGQGEEHRLTFELTESKTLSGEQFNDLAAALEAWTKLREQLAWMPRSLRSELTEAQIATLKQELPKAAAASRETPLAAIATAAQSDAQGQKNRAGAAAALRDAALGMPVVQSLGEGKLSDLGGKPLAAADLAGKVVVLHFWEYRDTPLEEPYGQVGYLDYLSRRRAADGVAVYGVHVDSRLADESTRRAAISSARKLQGFMNLSYPIVLDDGALLKRLGDPRPAGGKLPLFVVLDKQGKIVEYRPGLYDVKANDGLTELDAVITKAAAAK